jgi:hypothetical protein
MRISGHNKYLKSRLQFYVLNLSAPCGNAKHAKQSVFALGYLIASSSFQKGKSL